MIYFKHMKRFFFVFFSLVFLLLPQVGFAAGNFVLTPAKIEAQVQPGERKEFSLVVINNSENTETFEAKVEDVSGGKVGDSPAVLLGEAKGPYSLKDFIQFSVPRLTLKQGERGQIPITVSLPQNVAPGGLYGAVIVRPLRAEAVTTGTQAEVVPQLAALLFVRVPGEVREAGTLEDFSVKKEEKSDAYVFRVVYENSGTVYVNPYGRITIKNMVGRVVDTLVLDPWYVLPDSLRTREVTWAESGLFGRYTATLELNLGYGDIVQEKTVSVWVIPGYFWLLLVVILVAVIFYIRWNFVQKGTRG